ncbi:UDP-glucosyltransferase 29-like [Nymphaea colorata]|uniref:Glycosyltransferase N-terminal domain-containing protein n=1 Tax=Nymphaea colorata TaxID=210225 RepID=A0A5K0V6W9_9MAGN|nr:UDP-glucosyltransferase 29-like [Nymphaea colorata]
MVQEDLFRSKERQPRVLLLPWLAYGHISPFLELARHLSCRGFTTYLCSTHTNLSSIKEKLRQRSYSSIKTVELQLPSIPELPPKFQATSSLPSHLMPLLKKAFDLSKPAFIDILQALNPDFVIYDFLQPWAPLAASQLGIPAVLFLSTSAICFSYGRSRHEGHDQNVSPFKTIHFLEHEVENNNRMLRSEANGIRDVDRVNQCVDQSEDVIFIRSSREIERKFVDYLPLVTGKRVITVGSLLNQEASDHSASLPCKFTSWLGTKRSSSVVFVSFGTEYFMSKEEITEIALGLELSRQNFIWAVRFVSEEEEEGMERQLPEGFMQRVEGRGMVANQWIPQMEILSHPSIGGFLTHCGWGSLNEGMGCGVPFIALPLHLDQPLNAKLVVGELGLGVEIERERDGRFRREKVAEGIRRVMVGGEGEKMRRKAKEMAKKMKEKDDGEIDVLVGEVRKMTSGRGWKERGLQIREMK